MLESTRNMTPNSILNTRGSRKDVTPKQDSRNVRYTSTYQSLSKDIHSEETNVPTEGVLHSARWALKQNDVVPNSPGGVNLPHRSSGRGKSLGAMLLTGSFKSNNTLKTNDIRSIIDGDPRLQSEHKNPNGKSTAATNVIGRKNHQF